MLCISLILPLCDSYSLGGSQWILLLPIGMIRFPEWYPEAVLVVNVIDLSEPGRKKNSYKVENFVQIILLKLITVFKSAY